MSISPFHPASLISTWFCVGKIRLMPGTWGTLAALPFAWIIQTQFGSFALLTASLLTLGIGSWAAGMYMSKGGHEHDPGEIVIDEVAGVWLLLAALAPTINAYIAGFVIFRLFDILKPWPISYFDRNIHGGFGVMFDDIVAAIYPIVLIGLFTILCPFPGHGTTREILINTLGFHVFS